MNQTGIPICPQKSNQTLLTFPASDGAIPIQCPASQSFPYTISPALSLLSNNQSSYADDQVSLPTFVGASSREEVEDIIKPTIRNRRKAVYWTKKEHSDFLSGMELYGKGQWRNIAKLTVKTKTPTQVASHAQKYFIRQNLAPDKRKRSSIHDNTVADVISMPQKEPEQLLVASPIEHPTPFSQQQPQHAMAPTVQPPAPVESQAFPSTSYASVPVNVDQSDDLLYLPEWEWSSRFD